MSVRKVSDYMINTASDGATLEGETFAIISKIPYAS